MIGEATYGYALFPPRNLQDPTRDPIDLRGRRRCEEGPAEGPGGSCVGAGRARRMSARAKGLRAKVSRTAAVPVIIRSSVLSGAAGEDAKVYAARSWPRASTGREAGLALRKGLQGRALGISAFPAVSDPGEGRPYLEIIAASHPENASRSETLEAHKLHYQGNISVSLAAVVLSVS